MDLGWRDLNVVSHPACGRRERQHHRDDRQHVKGPSEC
jgi:hypothetical protein